MHGFPVPGRTADLARQAEDLGFDGLLLADSQNLVGDPFVELGVAAGATGRIGLGTGVVNLVTRHPAVVAAAIASVQVESRGRAVLGVGRGDSSLAQIGLAPPPAARLRDLVAPGPRLPARRGGDGRRHHEPDRLDRRAGLPAVPVEVAATGPRTLAFAATLADRVMFTGGAEPSRVAWALSVARRARAAAGLDPAGLRMGAYLNVGCDPDLSAACGLVRGSTAIFAHFSSMPGASAHGFSPPDEATIRQVGTVYDETRHGLSHAAHTAVLDDPFVARFAVVGSPERCLARLRQLIALGLDRIVMVPGSRDADPAALARSNERFAREVLPALRTGPA